MYIIQTASNKDFIYDVNQTVVATSSLTLQVLFSVLNKI